MLKLLPFSEQLIKIGNAPVANGEFVYSDGNVAYGWTWQIGSKTQKIKNFSGLWVNAFLQSQGNRYARYKLVKNGTLLLGDTIRTSLSLVSYYHYCYPWVATANVGTGGTVTNGTDSYHYDGDILSMDNTGRCITLYNNNYLREYANNGSYVDTLLTGSNYADYWNPQITYSNPVLQLVRCGEGAYCTIVDGNITYQKVHNGSIINVQDYPQTWTIGKDNSNNDIVLNLRNFTINMNGNTYNNDPLNLLSDLSLNPPGIISPDRIYGNGSYIADCKHNLLYLEDGQGSLLSKQYPLLFHNYTLAKLHKRWSI